MTAEVHYLPQKIKSKNHPLGIIATGISGAAAGFFIQQNKGTLEEIIYWRPPSGQLMAAAIVNLGFYAVRDLSFIINTGKSSGSRKNVESDFKYFSIFNASGLIGYLIGNAKDYLMP